MAVDLRLLEVFCAAVEVRSFTAAAEKLKISQPAVSKQVRSFEQWCGVQLLERSRSGVRPTAEGQRVYTEGRGLLEDSRRFREEVAALSRSSVKRLRISASYTIGEYLLPGWIDAFQHHEPEVVTELVVGNSDAVLSEFVAGKTDLCFIESGHAQSANVSLDLERVPVAWDRLLLVVAAGHHWAERESVCARELLSEPFISREPGSGTRVVAEQAFQKASLGPPKPVMELASTGSIKRALTAAHGYALLSGYAVREELARGEMVSPEIEDLDLRRSLDLVRLRGMACPHLAQRFLVSVGLVSC